MASSEQLESEAEQTRSELAGTLEELRERLSPGQLVDEAFDYAKASTGGEFFHNLRRQIAKNPLPVALIGAGIGWLALAGRNSSSLDDRSGARVRSPVEDVEGRAGTSANAAAERVGEWSSLAGEKATEASQYAADTAASLGESARDTAADAYGRAADTARRAGPAIGESARDFSNRASDALAFCKSQPLILAGLGLALGAVLGIAIPPTDTEDQLMGQTRDNLKDQARGAAEEQIDKVKTAVENDMENAPLQPEAPREPLADATSSGVGSHEDHLADLPDD